MECDIRRFVKELRNGLQGSSTQCSIVKWLTVTRAISVHGALEKDKEFLKTLGFQTDELSNLKCKIYDCHIKLVYETIISQFSFEWIAELTTQNFDSLVKPIFFRSIHKRQAFTSLLYHVHSSPK